MFPILAPKGSVIAFGGRALDKNAKAKYLNSPETPLFHKGGVLYNHAAARTAALDDGKPAIVCEGYMDVIAMWSAGFKTAVAPLGTALTEAQLELLWRMSNEPVLCFDGDRAGLGAAYRAIDRALPLLKPGRSLTFAFLPEGQDPDDLVRSGGASAVAAVLDRAEPLAGVLWRRETETRPLDTPERRAALRADLRKLVGLIADKDVRAAYGAEYAGRLQERFAPAPRPAAGRPAPSGRTGPGSRSGKGKKRDPREEARLDARPSADLRRRGGPSAWRREATLVLAAIRHPALVERREEAFLSLHLADAGLTLILSELLNALSETPGLDTDSVKAHLQRSPAGGPLERLLFDETLNQQRFLRPEAGLDEVDRGWSDALRLHLSATRAARETPEAAARLFNDGEDIWKAAAAAANELRIAPDDGESADGELTSRELGDALDRMRASVKARKGPRRDPQ
jgi:DNA primase